MAKLGLDHRDPLDYTGIKLNVIPVTGGSRQPTIYDTRFPLFCEWRVGTHPTSGTEGEFWKLIGFNGGQATWVQITTDSSGPVLSESDTNGNLVYPTASGNIQHEGTSGQITITADAANNKLVYSLPGGGGALDSVNVDFFTPPGTNPVIPTGAGAITITGAPVQWGVNPNFPICTRSNADHSLTIEIQAANHIATNPSDMLDAGICSFNENAFSVDANGFVSLISAGVPTVAVNVDAHTAPGTDPVEPDGSGQMTITGGQAAPGTVASSIQTNSLAANSFTIQVQQTSTAAAKDITLNGVAHFNSAHFSADQGFIDINTSFGKFVWVEVAVNTNMAVNTGYILNDGASHNLLLPATAAVGDVVKVIRKGAGGCVITQGASQVIHYNTSATTVGAAGTLTSSNQWDAITLTCVTANTTWVVNDSSGMWTTA